MLDHNGPTPAPQRVAGHWVWPATGPRSEILFVGKGPFQDRTSAYRDLARGAPQRLVWPRQIHSAIVHEVPDSGLCGDGDALVTDSDSVAVSVVTADCLPIVIDGPERLAVIHAGWRGLAQRIIETTLDRLSGDAEAFHVWIGPAIGACCYEVDWQVADRVAAVSDETVIHRTNARPRLDLVEAARVHLQRRRIEHVTTVDVCTRCSPEWLWSYRRDRPNTGRNWTFAWRRNGHQR